MDPELQDLLTSLREEIGTLRAQTEGGLQGVIESLATIDAKANRLERQMDEAELAREDYDAELEARISAALKEAKGDKKASGDDDDDDDSSTPSRSGVRRGTARRKTTTFALSPAEITKNNIIDYDTANGMKIYKSATTELNYKYDLDTDNVRLFLDTLEARSVNQGWKTNIMRIPVDGNYRSILQEYGLIEYNHVLTYAKTYAFRSKREAQDSANLYTCLEASLTEEAKRNVTADKAKYTIKATDFNPRLPGVQDFETFTDGLLYLKVILDRSVAKTNATISVIIDRLSDLENQMVQFDSNVKDFNTYVTQQLSAYQSNKGQEYDQQVLTQALFKAYAKCSDQAFCNYIQRTSEQFDDGDTITPQELMTKAFKHYQGRVTKGNWNEESPEQKRIVSLTATVEAQQKQLKGLQNWKKRRNNQDNSSKQAAEESDSGNEVKKPLSRAEKAKQRYDQSPAWMKQRPTNGKGTKLVEGVRYWWCPTHKLWVQHKPEDCKFKQRLLRVAGKANNKLNMEQPKIKDKAKGNKPGLALNQKLSMIAEEEDQLDYDEQDEEFDYDEYDYDE